MTTLGDVLKGIGINIHGNMGWPELIVAWALVPSNIKNKYPAINSSIIALTVASTALTTARKAYETAHDTLTKAEKTYNSAIRVIIAPGTGTAATIAETASDQKAAISLAQDSAVQASATSIKTAILNTPAI
jgi:sulfite reductase alpha subunit-like flavoprotein